MSHTDKEKIHQMSQPIMSLAEDKHKSSTKLNSQLNSQSKPGISFIYESYTIAVKGLVLVDKELTEKQIWKQDIAKQIALPTKEKRQIEESLKTTINKKAIDWKR